MLKKIHLWIGIIGMILFLLSGLYFKLALHGLQDMENLPRLILRTSHVYLFFASAINMVVGLYYTEPEKLKRSTIINHSLLMVSPLLITYSFVFEAFNNSGIDRPISNLGVILVFIWLVIAAISKAVKQTGS